MSQTTADVKTPAVPAGRRPRARRGPSLWRRMVAARWLYLMLLPGLIHLALFKLAPVSALVIAFQDFSSFLGIGGSPWVGFQNFVDFFNDPAVGRLVVNTVILAVLVLFVSFPIPIAFALLLNEVRLRWFRKSVQTLSFVPYFVSSAVLVSIMYTLLSPSGGVVNIVIEAFGGSAVSFFTEPEWFRPLYTTMHVWQNFGYSVIIYVAAMSSIDPALYEAAELDGAGRWRKMFSVTLPGISTMIAVMLILNVGQILTVDLDKILLMYNPSVYETADVIQTYVYRLAFASDGFPDYSYAAAVGLIQGLIAFVLVVATNRASRRFSDSRVF
ncbi:ABC transporter permease [Microbacterium marinilacus]|uniref:Polygalacturonan/rhamnogalacturonan ABC transporter permease n=1 Tax=Microbacterium marinilacus TaxID=415209 RepID=A0ABP7BXX6_9MICO|nr:ABC transporter permease subunit [Microbacterium marinilacus]MBY0688111.1 ABC transporter permease subunit [Microbacterium marinilacus]